MRQTSTGYSIVSSSDGSFLVAVHPSAIFKSSDYGVTWREIEVQTNPLQYWWKVACSGTGRYIVAVGRYYGLIYTSNDFGETWIENSAPASDWYSVATSDDGRFLVAVVIEGGIFHSADYGVNWVETSAPVATWNSVASSSTGQFLVACDYQGLICTSSDFGKTWIGRTNPNPTTSPTLAPPTPYPSFEPLPNVYTHMPTQMYLRGGRKKIAPNFSFK